MNSKYDSQDFTDPEHYIGPECSLTPAEVMHKYLYPDPKTEAEKVDPITTTVRLYPGTVAELDRLAGMLGVSRSKLISEFLEGALAEALQYLDDEHLKNDPSRQGPSGP